MLSKEVLEKLLSFRNERDWEQFHSHKNVSIALCVEAAELLEIFQWSNEDGNHDLIERRRKDIEHEIADIAILLSYLCHDLKIDLEKVIQAKIELNRQKYPVEKARGNAEKYDRL
jgi:dCTP diphosphatase